jgi:(2R)-sulfolactate sulfo-lyase subunit alpha
LKPKVLIHNHGDCVGVATDDISKGEDVTCVFMDRREEMRVRSRDDIPLGHKMALTMISAKDKVIEYGATIGVATSKIEVGEHVHIHNLRSLRL